MNNNGIDNNNESGGRKRSSLYVDTGGLCHDTPSPKADRSMEGSRAKRVCHGSPPLRRDGNGLSPSLGLQDMVPTGDELVQGMIGQACFARLSGTPDGKKALALLTASALHTGVAPSAPSSRPSASSLFGSNAVRNDGSAYTDALTPVPQKNAFRSMADLSPLAEGGARAEARTNGATLLYGADFGPADAPSPGPSRSSSAASAYLPGSVARRRSTPRSSHNRIGNPTVERLLAKENAYRHTCDTITDLSRFEMDAEEDVKNLKDMIAEAKGKISDNASSISGLHIEIGSLKGEMLSKMTRIKDTDAANVVLEDEVESSQKLLAKSKAQIKGYQTDQMELSDRAAKEGYEIKVLRAKVVIDGAAGDEKAGMFIGVPLKAIREAHGIFKPYDIVTRFTEATEDGGPAYDRIVEFNRMLVKGKANRNGEYLAMWCHKDWRAKFKTVGEWKTGKEQNGDTVTLNQWYTITASRLFLEIFETVNDLRKASGIDLGDKEKYGAVTYSGPVWK